MTTASIVILGSALAWLLFGALSAVAESFYFFHLNQATDKRGKRYDHFFLTLLRGYVLAPWVIIIYFFNHSLVSVGFFELYASCIFPFVHDNLYYAIRHKMQPLHYPLGWRDHVDGRASIDLSFTGRIMFAIIALAALAASIL